MQNGRFLWAIVLLPVLAACGSDGGSAPVPDGPSQSGDGDGDGDAGAGGPVVSDAGGPVVSDAGGDAGEADEIVRPEACAAPIGTYKYTVRPHVVSGPCDHPTQIGSLAWFDSNQNHSYSADHGMTCTVVATTTEHNGCTRIDERSCSDGSSLRTVCELDADATVLACTATKDFVTHSCDLEFKTTRTSAVDACTPLGGLYEAAITRTAGTDMDGCAKSTTVELTDTLFSALLTRTTRCSWKQLALAGDSCSLTRDATCPEGDQASMDCTWNTDSTEVTCKAVVGKCAYDLAMVR